LSILPEQNRFIRSNSLKKLQQRNKKIFKKNEQRKGHWKEGRAFIYRPTNPQVTPKQKFSVKGKTEIVGHLSWLSGSFQIFTQYYVKLFGVFS